MDQTFMKEKPVLPLVLKMALPMVISMLVNSLYNIVDSFFVAQVSEDAMTAISIVYPLQNLANAIGVGFGVGINAAVAYYLGAGNGKAANRSATLGIILSALHGIVHRQRRDSCIRPRLFLYRHRVRARADSRHGVRKSIAGDGKNEDDDVLYGNRSRRQYHTRPHLYFRARSHSRNGRIRGGARHGDRTDAFAYQLYCRIPACKNTRAPAVGAPRRRKDLPQTLLCGYPRLLKFGAALLYDNGAQRHTCGICRSLCSDIGCLLQIADVYLFHHKRHCARYTPVN